MKTLYFEGAGSATEASIAAGVGNCRIRTAFHTADGRRVYLGIMQGYKENTAVVCSAFYITGGNDDENENRIKVWGVRKGKYTPEGILEIVKECGGDFDAVRVLADLDGYRVFRDNYGGYNYGDEFAPDEAITAKRTAIHAECYRLEYEARKRDRDTRGGVWCNSLSGGIYPSFSLYVPQDRPEILCWRLFDGKWTGTHELNINGGSVRECIKAVTGWTDETYGDFSKAVK